LEVEMSISFNPTQALLMTHATAINIALTGSEEDDGSISPLASSAMLVVRAIYRFERELGYYLAQRDPAIVDSIHSHKLRPVRKYHRLLTDALRDFEKFYNESMITQGTE
jgi:hypothetical protein